MFENPKPTELLRALATIANVRDGEIVLDFFAGSGSTADAMMRMNAEDGIFRRVISVQLPEPIEEGTPAQDAGFRTIAELSRARIDRAGTKVREQVAGQTVDVGYRAYSLADTNFAKWRTGSDVDVNKLEQHLLDLRDSASDTATSDDLLAEVLLKQGYSLTEDIAIAEAGGLSVRSVGDGLVLAYLDEHTKPSLDQLRALVDEGPQRLVILEDAFHGDDELKTNLAQLCKSKGIELWTA